MVVIDIGRDVVAACILTPISPTCLSILTPSLPSSYIQPKLARLAQQMAGKKSPQWRNRQRTLVFAARGITFRIRHLLYDVR